MTFKQLRIGQWFDFIKDPPAISNYLSSPPAYNSFYDRVEKISARKYRNKNGTEYTVGTVNVTVYHYQD